MFFNCRRQLSLVDWGLFIFFKPDHAAFILHWVDHFAQEPISLVFGIYEKLFLTSFILLPNNLIFYMHISVCFGFRVFNWFRLLLDILLRNRNFYLTSKLAADLIQ